jgi:hypothetical protein
MKRAQILNRSTTAGEASSDLARGDGILVDGRRAGRQLDGRRRRGRRVDDAAVEPDLPAGPRLHLDAAHLDHRRRELLLPQRLVGREAAHQRGHPRVHAQLVVGEEEPHAARQQLVVVVVQHVGRPGVHGRRDGRRLRRVRRAQRAQQRRVRRAQPRVHLHARSRTHVSHLRHE